MTLHRKVGGIHWLRLGRLRIAWCWTTNRKPDPIRLVYERRANG